MKSRTFILSLTAAALSLPLLAGAQTFVEVDREAGFVLQSPAPASAQRPVERARSVADTARPGGFGWREARGNAGWVFVGHEYARRDGQWVCIDGIDHGARADRTPYDSTLHAGA